jgi:CHAD domain-containing protein
MPATLFILRHWKKQEKLFFENLNKLRLATEPNAIHDLRVAFKKLRSYKKLLDIVSKEEDNAKQLFEKTEQLFGVLGKHRDIETGLLLLQAFEKENKVVYTEAREHLKTLLLQAGEWVKNALEEYEEKGLKDTTLEIEQHLKGTARQEILDKFRYVVNKKLKGAGGLAIDPGRHPHRVRKFFKDIFYWASLSPKDILSDSEELKKIKRTLGYLGDWQDHEMLHRKIKHFRKDFLPVSSEEYDLLKNLENQIGVKMKTLLDKAKVNI